MPKRSTKKQMNPTIVVAIIGLIGTVVTAVLSSPILVAKYQNSNVSTSTTEQFFFTSEPLPATTSNADTQLPSSGKSIDGFENILTYNDNWTYSLANDFESKYVELPDNVTPDLDHENSYDKVFALIQNQEIYLLPPIAPMLILQFTLQNIQGNDGLDIKIEKKVNVKVTMREKKDYQVNAIDRSSGFLIPVGGYTFKFSPVLLNQKK